MPLTDIAWTGQIVSNKLNPFQIRVEMTNREIERVGFFIDVDRDYWIFDLFLFLNLNFFLYDIFCFFYIKNNTSKYNISNIQIKQFFINFYGKSVLFT